jgi:hypothetical protein
VARLFVRDRFLVFLAGGAETEWLDHQAEVLRVAGDPESLLVLTRSSSTGFKRASYRAGEVRLPVLLELLEQLFPPDAPRKVLNVHWSQNTASFQLLGQTMHPYRRRHP